METQVRNMKLTRYFKADDTVRIFYAHLVIEMKTMITKMRCWFWYNTKSSYETVSFAVIEMV